MLQIYINTYVCRGGWSIAKTFEFGHKMGEETPGIIIIA